MRVVFDQPFRRFERGVLETLMIDRRVQQADQDLQFIKTGNTFSRHVAPQAVERCPHVSGANRGVKRGGAAPADFRISAYA